MPFSECALWDRSWDWNLLARQKFMIRTLERKSRTITFSGSRQWNGFWGCIRFWARSILESSDHQRAPKAVVVYMQDRNFNSFACNMMKLSVNEKWKSILLARTRAIRHLSWKTSQMPSINDFQKYHRTDNALTTAKPCIKKPSIKAVTITTCLTMSHVTRNSSHGRTDQETFFGKIHLLAKMLKRM